MGLTPYLVRGITGAITQELDTNLYGIPEISELDQADRAASWPDPLDAPARVWLVTIHQAHQPQPEQRLICLDREEFVMFEE